MTNLDVCTQCVARIVNAPIEFGSSIVKRDSCPNAKPKKCVKTASGYRQRPGDNGQEPFKRFHESGPQEGNEEVSESNKQTSAAEERPDDQKPVTFVARVK